MEIRLLDADELEPEGAFLDALSRVPDTRKDKVLRMRFGEGQRLSLAAGVLLADWMREEGMDPMTAALTEGPNGKPYLPEAMLPEASGKNDVAHSAASAPHTPNSRILACASAHNGPSNPRAPFFNLSHAGHYAVLAVSDREVGVDIERIEHCHTDVAKRFFHPSEQALLLHTPEDRQRDIFCDIWTRKEACLKATGDGLSLSLESFSVVDAHGHFSEEVLLPHARLKLTPHCAPEGYRLSTAEVSA